jgi:hypothetical protein
MKIARHFPVFRVGSTATVIKSFDMKLWHLSEIHLIQ